MTVATRILIGIATIVLPVLASVGILRVQTSIAAGYAVLTVVVGDAIITLPSRQDNVLEGWVLFATLVMTSVVAVFGLQLAALPVMAAPILLLPPLYPLIHFKE
jgi:hypothetical protein